MALDGNSMHSTQGHAIAFERVGDARQRVERNCVFHAFDLADVFEIPIGQRVQLRSMSETYGRRLLFGF